MKHLKVIHIISTLLLIGVIGCQSDGGYTGGNTGSLGIAVTDAPIDGASAVNITFTGVEIHGKESKTVNLGASNLDVFSLRNGASATLLNSVTLEAGNYSWIRLILDVSASTITLLDGTTHCLEIPSGAETGLKLNRAFNVGIGSRTDFVIDFDLRKSVNNPEGSACYTLRPTLRIVDSLEVGTVTGTINPTLATDVTCNGGDIETQSNAVYIFDAGATIEDTNINNSGGPITSSEVVLDEDSNYSYVVGFVPVGDYTIAFTCDAAMDNSGTTDNINFSSTKSITVTVGAQVTANF